MDSDVIRILVFAPRGQVEFIETALAGLEYSLEITIIEDAMQADHYLVMAEQWSLVLCSMLTFSLHTFRRSLQQARSELLASVVVLQSPSQRLGVDAVYGLGGDDIVSLGNARQLCAVAQREIVNAQARRTLKGLLSSQVPAGMTSEESGSTRPDSDGAAPPPDALAALSEEHERIYRLLNSRAVILQYQGIATIASHDAGVGLYEVFVRLADQDGKLVYPAEFFPIAEQFQLMPRIDLTVVQQAIATLEEQYREGETRMRLFIKLSDQTVEDKRYCNGIISLIASAKIPRGSLVVELGEKSFSNYPQQVNLMHATLTRRGHGLSYDACSMEECQKMKAFSPLLGYLKLNQPLVDGIVVDTEKRQRLGQFIACATSEGLKTIATRIEHADIVPLLYAVGVTHIQGYFVGEMQHEPGSDDSGPSLENFDTPLYCLN